MKRFIALLFFAFAPVATAVAQIGPIYPAITLGTSPQTTGFATIMPDDQDTVHSYYRQAGHGLHFRLSRPTNNNPYGAPTDFIVAPYLYGMEFDYAGVAEWAVYNFSVHANHSLGGTDAAFFWVGDESDLGGLFATANYPSNYGPNGNVTIAADKFDHTSHGKMLFTVRNNDDAFYFNWGPYGSEVTKAAVSLDPSGAINIGSVANVPVNLVVGGKIVMTWDPDGSVVSYDKNGVPHQLMFK